MTEEFSPTSPEKMFRFHVLHTHYGFVERTVRCLFTSCRQAKDHCDAFFPGPEGRDLRGHYFRAIFEKEWRAIGARARGVDGKSVPNSRCSYHHTRITCGPVVITASHVATPSVLVERAEFRETYARSVQLELFDQPEKPAFDAPLYALLLYGLEKDKAMPAFADIVFPDQDCKRYLGRVQLFREFSELVAKLSNRTVAPATADDEFFTVKPRTAQKGG